MSRGENLGYVVALITPAIVTALSLLVTDAGGLHPLGPIPPDAAQAISDECLLHPFYRFPWVPGDLACAGLYVLHSFRESGWDLHAKGDYTDALGRPCTPPGFGECRPHAFGPFQVWRRAPLTWAEACQVFTQLLQRASVCDEPLEMLAAGKCGTVDGARISRVRTGGALGILYQWWMTP